MSKTFKIVLILLLVASIGSAVMAVFAFMGKEREYMKRLLVEDKLAATLKEKRRIEKEIDDSKKAVQEAEVKVSALQADVEKATQQAEEEKQKNKTITLDLADKKRALETLEKDLEKEKQEKLSISKKLEDLQFDYEKVKKEITRMKNENTMLEGRISELKEKSVDLDRIVVKPESNAVTPYKELLRGRVLVVNKEYNFIVIDVGQNDGVEKGVAIEIREGTELLGKAEIDKVYETMSSATLLPGANINFIKKGNLVIESR
jgi:peptidoglycan hydrolase CwlO-like protein